MIDGIPIANLAPPTLIGIFFLLVFFGRLIPRYLYEAKVEECEKWRLAFEAERDARINTAQQTQQLVATTSEIHQVVGAVFKGAELTQETGEAYVVPTFKTR